ncbi:MAG: carbohydrate kinase family protein [Planctomycetes bacterium]|nr:carbohydrate kinase family protein [Planctomycetota bacterium]
MVADHVCDPIDHLPDAGELVLTDRMHLTIGGCASNVAVDLAKLGHNVAVVGKVGADVFGRSLRDALEASKVDCEHIVESPTQQTSGTLVINTKGEDRRFIHAVGANAEFTGKEVTDELIENTRVLYLGGYCLMDSLSAENVAALFQKARQAGVTTVLDVVIPKPADYRLRLQPVLPWTDVFCPNDDEAKQITGFDDPLQQADEFHKAGAKTVVITCGEHGAVVVSENLRFRTGCFNVDFVDGTGSGDAFTAGFIHGLLAGDSVRNCIKNGSALGASCVRSAGATTGVFTAEELESFVASQELQIEKN